MIVDALNDPFPAFEADVAGDDITMCPGSGLVATGDGVVPGTAAVPNCYDDDQTLGGVGRPTNWLEINVDILDRPNGVPGPGVVRIFDTFADTTEGVFVGETVHDLKVHTIHTLHDVSRGRSPAPGSIVDARNGGAGIENGAPNVIGNTIDLDANGGSIGSTAGTNDLEIDSFVGASPYPCTLANTGYQLSANCDVGLEADTGIFLTETDKALNLLLAHARNANANIRLTVRETADTDEDLNLLDSGDVLFAESRRRLPTGPCRRRSSSPSRDRCCCASATTSRPHQNSEILADESIDIYGDCDETFTLTPACAGNADATYGTIMILRGRIVADCVVTLGPAATGPAPVGTCTPSTAVPNDARITQIWGDTDVDTFQFGDRPRRRRRQDGDTTTATSSSARRRGSTAARTSTPPATTARTGSSSATCSRRTCSRRPAQLGDVSRGRRPLAHARRPGRHRLLHDLHDRQPRRRAQLRHQRARHRRVERRRRRARRSTASTTSTRRSTATCPAR